MFCLFCVLDDDVVDDGVGVRFDLDVECLMFFFVFDYCDVDMWMLVVEKFVVFEKV